MIHSSPKNTLGRFWGKWLWEEEEGKWGELLAICVREPQLTRVFCFDKTVSVIIITVSIVKNKTPGIPALFLLPVAAQSDL